MEKNKLKKIQKKFQEIYLIEDPIERCDKVIKYLQTHPLNTIDVPIFILQELKTLWSWHKDL